MELRNFLFPNVDFRETRASSFGSGPETASLMNKASMIDLRKIGCPEDIFEFVLEQRAAYRSVEHRDDIQIIDNHREAMQLQMEHALRS
jgi:hypothetical protein